MNVLMINGSPRINGNTTIALEEMRKAFDEEGNRLCVSLHGIWHFL